MRQQELISKPLRSEVWNIWIKRLGPKLILKYETYICTQCSAYFDFYIHIYQ